MTALAEVGGPGGAATAAERTDAAEPPAKRQQKKTRNAANNRERSIFNGDKNEPAPRAQRRNPPGGLRLLPYEGRNTSCRRNKQASIETTGRET